MCADIADRLEVENIFADVVELSGGLDIYLTNTGISDLVPIIEVQLMCLLRTIKAFQSFFYASLFATQ